MHVATSYQPIIAFKKCIRKNDAKATLTTQQGNNNIDDITKKRGGHRTSDMTWYFIALKQTKRLAILNLSHSIHSGLSLSSNQVYEYETSSAMDASFHQTTSVCKPAASLDQEDFTETTIPSDSLSDVRSTHVSSYDHSNRFRSPSDDDDSSSSLCSSTSSFNEIGEESLSQNAYTDPLSLHRPELEDLPEYPSIQWRKGYDSFSLLNTIESASEDDFSVDDDSEGGLAEDERGSEDEEDFAILCSSRSKRIRILGEGAFGQVWLVLRGHMPYALKVCAKYDLVTEGAVQGVLRERKIMGQLHHPFICQLVHANQDDKFLYMLEEYCAGGELFSLLDRQGKLQVPSCRFYIACIADALAYMHEQLVIFRDLKPENIMLDEHGFPKLIDFGCARQFVANKDGENCAYQTHTLCGTPRFVSPEMIVPDRYGNGHSFATDYWALGVLLYEMLMGASPYEFDGMTEGEVYESIVDEGYHPSLSDELDVTVHDLLDKLLVHDPSQRLGSKDESEVLNHRWFVDLDMAKLCQLSKQMVPWCPDLSDSSSTMYFEDWDNVLESKFSQSYPNLSTSEGHMFVNF